MPIPTPQEGESAEEFIPRCISFLTTENKKKPEKDRRPAAQIKAMCYGQIKNKSLQQHVCLSVPISLEKRGNVLRIEGDLLKVGVWVGLDGAPVKYSKAFLHRISKSLVGRPIVFAHELSPESMDARVPKGTTVGFWTGTTLQGESLLARGYVFNPVAITYLHEHPNTGLSMEADIRTSYNSALGVEEAESGMLTGGALIESPACPSCRLSSTREINLERGKGMEKTNDSIIEFNGDTVPTRESFFAWLEGQQKNAGVPPELQAKVLETLRKSIAAPFSIPAPKVEPDIVRMLHSEKELGEFDAFMKICTASKDASECVGEWKKTHMGEEKKPEGDKPEGDKPGEEKPEEVKQLEEKLANTKAELANLQKTVNMQLGEEIQGLIGTIKEYDKDFDGKKYLEGIDCQGLQKKLLQRYVDTLKKHAKPIRLQVGDEAAKAAVKKEVEGMFGDGATLESIIGVS